MTTPIKQPYISNCKIIKLVNGDEIACQLPKDQLDEKSPLLRIEEPFALKIAPRFVSLGVEESIMLVRWNNFTPDKIINIPKDKIISIVNADKTFTRHYNNVKSDYKNYKVKFKEKHTNDLNKLNKLVEQLKKNESLNEDEQDDLFDEPNMPSKKLH